MEKTAKIYTLGCKVNQYDSLKISDKLESAGFRIVKEKAELSIVNTCAVTHAAIKKAKRMILRARKENPDSELIVTGCWPKVYGQEILKYGIYKSVDKVIKEYSDIENETVKFHKHRSRYFLKIQDGCNQFCSYCVIPYARGGLKSRPELEVLNEIKLAIEKGYKEIVLCGIHLGLYGVDQEKKINLNNLIHKILKLEGLGRIRLSSIEMNEVNEELIFLIKNSKGKICKHLHIPLQSGSDKILKLMNRPYNTEKFKNKILQIKKAIPDISVTTDVIVGFPGETEAEFNETFKFAKELNFSKIHVFSFSAHEKTPAYKMPGRVKEDVKRKRADKLRNLSKRLEKEFKKRFVGKKLALEIEQIKENGNYIGKSEFYFDLIFKKSELSAEERKAKVGDIVKIQS